MTTIHCQRRCGQCCVKNGLIPPLVPGDESVVPWLQLTVDQLRERFGDVAEDYPCLYLSGEKKCLIYRDRPHVCREFKCDGEGPPIVEHGHDCDCEDCDERRGDL